MEDSIGRDNLEIALKRAESEQRDRKTSEHSGSVSPVKAGSRQNLERSLSQETSTPKKSSNPQSRQNSVLPKEEKKEAEKVRHAALKLKASAKWKHLSMKRL